MGCSPECQLASSGGGAAQDIRGCAVLHYCAQRMSTASKLWYMRLARNESRRQERLPHHPILARAVIGTAATCSPKAEGGGGWQVTEFATTEGERERPGPHGDSGSPFPESMPGCCLALPSSPGMVRWP